MKLKQVFINILSNSFYPKIRIEGINHFTDNQLVSRQHYAIWVIAYIYFAPKITNHP